MMLCHEARALLAREIDSDVPDDQRALLSGHVLGCGECSAYREELHAIAVVLDAVCLPLREEAADIVAEMPAVPPGRETVPVRWNLRFVWGVLAAILLLLIVALIAASARSA